MRRSPRGRRTAVVLMAMVAAACSPDPSDSSDISDDSAEPQDTAAASATGLSTATQLDAGPRPDTTPTTRRRRPPAPPSSPPADSTSPPTSAVPVPVPTGEDPLSCLASLPTDVLAGQLVWPAVYGDQLASQAQTFADWGVGGALLMTWPDTATPEQLQAFKRAPAVPLLIATDEEGGDVQRFRRLGELPSQASVAATTSADDAELLIAGHAAVLADVGVDVVFGPVVDVGPADGSAGPMEDRVFSSDPNVVAEYAAAYVRGWQRGGIVPVLKHFPGHGSASADTHVAVARTPALDELLQRDLVPYRGLADDDVGVMVGHLDVPGLTDDITGPATLSPTAITNLLRNQLGYGSRLVVTDALDMDAVSARTPLADAAAQSVAAGADVVIYSDATATPTVTAALVAAVEDGRIPPGRLHQAAQHVLETKGIDPCDVSPGS